MSLVVKRRSGEKVIMSVGEIKIEVEISELKGKTVQLHFTAPPEVKIDREERLRKMDVLRGR